MVLLSALLCGCAAQPEPVETANNVVPSFYPPGGMGDVVQYETLSEALPLKTKCEGLTKVTVQAYKVDKWRFYDNTIGAMAAFEGHIDPDKFLEAKLLYDGEMALQVQTDACYLDLPIEEEGYYYIAYSYPSSTGNPEDTYFHTLLHIGPADSFNYGGHNNSGLQEPWLDHYDFIFTYGIDGAPVQNEFNTVDGTFTKDMIGGDPITVSFVLSEEEVKSVMEKYDEIPDFSDLDIEKPQEFTVVSPCEKYSFEASHNLDYSIHGPLEWDCSLNYGKRKEFADFLINLIESKSEYKALPQSEGGYM